MIWCSPQSSYIQNFYTEVCDHRPWDQCVSDSPCMTSVDKQYPRKWQIYFQNSETLARQDFCAGNILGNILRKRLMATWKPNISKDKEELTGFCQPSYCCSLFCTCQKHRATGFKTMLAPRFSVLFFPVRFVEKFFSNQERRARCKLRTSSFTMCPIRLLNICLAAFDARQAQGGKIVHSQVWWGCFKSLLGAPQRN